MDERIQKKVYFFANIGVTFTIVLVLALLYQKEKGSYYFELILPQNKILPGQAYLFKVRAWNEDKTQGYPGINLIAQLRQGKKVLWKHYGKTESKGQCQFSIPIPENISGKYSLEVRSYGNIIYGNLSIERSLSILETGMFYISCDKPFYQPGQNIHIRGVFLSVYNQKPIEGKNVFIEIEDCAQNKIFRKSFLTSKYGIVSTSFKLANEIKHGLYKVTLTNGDIKKEHVFEVKKYILPKYKTYLEFTRSYVRSGKNLQGKVRAQYIFGTPVKYANVSLSFSIFEKGKKNIFHSFQGKTDRNGIYPFSVSAPEIKSPSNKSLPLIVESKVTSQEGIISKQKKTLSLVFCPFLWDIIPETGHIVPDVENIIYCIVTSPDGAPIEQAKIFLENQNTIIKTNIFGIATWKYIPKEKDCISGSISAIGEKLHFSKTFSSLRKETFGALDKVHVFIQSHDTVQVLTLDDEKKPVYTKVEIPKFQFKSKYFTYNHEFYDSNKLANPSDTFDVIVKDRYGNSKTVSYSFSSQMKKASYFLNDILDNEELSGEETPKVLLRTQKSIYSQGEEMKVDIVSSETGTHWVSLSKNGCIISLKSKKLPQKKGTITFTPSLSGTIDITAYTLIKNRKYGISKKLFILKKNDLHVQVTTNKNTYKPGDTAKITFQLQNKKGKPKSGVFGITVVDERIFALGNFIDKNVSVLDVHENLTASDMMPSVIPLGFSFSNMLATYSKGKWTNKHNTLSNILIAKNTKYISEKITSSYTGIAEHKLQKLFTKVVRFLYPYSIILFLVLFVSFISYQSGNDAQKILAAKLLNNSIIIILINTFVSPLISSIYSGAQISSKNNFTPLIVWLSLLFFLVFFLFYSMRIMMISKKENRTQFHWNLWGIGIFYQVVCIFTIMSVGLAGRFLQGDITFGDYFIYFVISYGILMYLAYKKEYVVLQKPKNTTKSSFSVFNVASLTIVLFAIFSTMLLPSLGSVMEKARQIKHKASMHHLSKMAKMMQEDNNMPSRIKEDMRKTRKPLKIRTNFPETLYVNPSLITNNKGIASISIPLADSITQWRLSTMAHTLDGRRTNTRKKLKVFKPFFVDINTPLHMIQEDQSLIGATIYNYTRRPQAITLMLKTSKGIHIDKKQYKQEVAGNDAVTIFFLIKAKNFGSQYIQAIAKTEDECDGIKKYFEVEPNGKKIITVKNFTFTGNMPISLGIPHNSIPRASSLSFRVIDSPLAETISGMESMARAPHG